MKTVGWKETVDFVDLELFNVPAKIDTGAKTSVLHCGSIEYIKKGKRQYVKFVPLGSDSINGKAFILPFHKERTIKNSFGNEENRFIIRTRVRMFGAIYDIEVSLRDRSNMEFPMLLGRSFIRKKFLVDVNRAELSKKYKPRKKKDSV